MKAYLRVATHRPDNLYGDDGRGPLAGLLLSYRGMYRCRSGSDGIHRQFCAVRVRFTSNAHVAVAYE